MSGEQYAILVGVSDYEKLTKLECGGDDAAAVRDALVQAEFDPNNIYLLADPSQDSKGPKADRYEGAYGRPTKEDIDEVLEEFAHKELDPDDTILFFFSGHGIRHEGDFLMPRAANAKIIAKSCLKITDVVKTLLKTGSKQIILMLDACRDELKSKSVGMGLEVEEYVASLKDRKGGVGILFSCQQEAKSYIVADDEGRRWSAFSKGLVDAIGSPDHVTLGQVETYLETFLQTYNQGHGVPAQKPRLIQNPNSVAKLALFGSPGRPHEEAAHIGALMLGLERDEDLDVEISNQVIGFAKSREWFNDDDKFALGRRKRIQKLVGGEFTVARFLESWKDLEEIESRERELEKRGRRTAVDRRVAGARAEADIGQDQQ